MSGAFTRSGGLRSFLLILALSPLLSLLSSCGARVCLFFSTTPQITAITPTAVVVGVNQFQLTILGNNFGDEVFVFLSDGIELQPTFISNTKIIILLPDNELTSPGTLIIRVSDPCTGFSNSVALQIIV